MAILPDCPGLKVEVLVNGEALKEFGDDETPPPKTIVRYIEAVSDAQFGIQYECTPPFPSTYGVKARLQLDGGAASKRIHESKGLLGKKHNFMSRRCQIDGVAFSQNYRFSKITIGDLRNPSTLHLHED